KFAEIVYFIPIAIAVSYYAGMVRSHDTSKDMFRSEMQALFDVVGLVTIALALAVAITAWFILIPTFGADYAEAVPMVAVLAPSVVFVGLGVARSNVLTIEGWNWTSFVTTSAGAVLNVGLNLVLIPHYGGIGAALATVAAYAFAVIGGSYLLPWMWPVAGALVRSLNPIGAARRVARLAATQGETAV
ncbi:MAG: polysaccharide biosynthesis C-terminal domain-containing protein, partial [Pseudomonadota bacterium]